MVRVGGLDRSLRRMSAGMSWHRHVRCVVTNGLDTSSQLNRARTGRPPNRDHHLTAPMRFHQEDGMAEYVVECIGEIREVYIVEADSPEDAMARWHEGTLELSEASSVEPVAAREDE